jgi:hypothetical protein
MSQQTPPPPALPSEPPELAARREQLLSMLEKEARTATGTARPVLLKMHELLTNTRPGEPFNTALYEGVKAAFVDFTQAPVFPPPAIIMECLMFMQERQVAFLNATPSSAT